MAKKTKTSAIIGLYVEHVRDGDFYHVNAHPVYVGITPSDMARVDRGDKPIHNVDSDEIRNCSGYDGDDMPNGLYLENLKVRSQGNNSDAERHLYGFEVDYHNIYSVDLRMAKRMAATLTTIEKRMAALYEKFGNAATIGAYMLRVADAIGATRIVLRRDKSRHSHMYNERTHVVRELASGAWEIDHAVKEWQTERETAAAKRAEEQQEYERRMATVTIAPTSAGVLPEESEA